MTGICDQDYEPAQQSWNRLTPEFQNVTLGDYHHAYVATDILLLSDVFETFRNTCLKHFKLDPAYFCTQLRLAWLAALKMHRRKS